MFERRERSEQSEFDSAPRPRAPQVARSEAEGRSQWGRFFFGYFLLEGVEKTNYTKRLSNMRACASQTHAVA